MLLYTFKTLYSTYVAVLLALTFNDFTTYYRPNILNHTYARDNIQETRDYNKFIDV